MIRYLCETCEAGFDAPLKKLSLEWIDDRRLRDEELLCPVCCQPHFAEADTCPACGGPKFVQAHLCRACRRDLKRRFSAFADSLTEEEEDQLDDWLDGVSVKDRRNWN